MTATDQTLKPSTRAKNPADDPHLFHLARVVFDRMSLEMQRRFLKVCTELHNDDVRLEAQQPGFNDEFDCVGEVQQAADPLIAQWIDIAHKADFWAHMRISGDEQ
jgi:hypothetical protein